MATTSHRKETPIPNKSIYSDFSTSFARHPINKDLLRQTDSEAVRKSIKNLIMTDRYERLLNPELGSNIRSILFEPMLPSTTIALRDYIEETLKNYEKRAIVNNIIVEPDYDLQTYYVKIVFSLAYSNQRNEVDLFLERIR